MTEPTGSQFRVLLVEDDDDHAELAEFHLKKLDPQLKLIRLRDGMQAIEVLRECAEGKQTEPDLVLLDLNLPAMSGLEVLDAIRQEPRLTRVRVVVLSTSDSRADKQRAYERNAASYLVKPTSFSDYRQLMQQILSYWRDCNRLPKPA